MHYTASSNLDKSLSLPNDAGVSFRFKTSATQPSMSESQKAQLKKIGKTEIPSPYDVFAIADLYRCKPLPCR
jgi:hypothetical protein